MSQFAGLDFSDNEDDHQTKKGGVAKKTTKDTTTTKDAANKPKAESKPKDQAANKPVKVAKTTEPAPVAAGDADIAKDNNRGGRPRGKDSKRSEKRREGEEGGKKRQFDRRSGTGRGKEVSKDGRGRFGAGNVDQEAQDAEKNPEVALEGAVATEEDAGVEEAKAEPEPQDASISFDEFLRKREEARLNSSLLAPAKATRVVDVQTQFAGLTTKEDSEDTYIAGKNSKTSGQGKKDQRSTSKTQVLDVAFRFEAPAPVERRSDNRGGRGNGKPRQQNNRRSAPANAFSGGDFPSL